MKASPAAGKYWLDVLGRIETQGAQAALKSDPLGFAMFYLSHHLHGRETEDQISFAACHCEWYAQMSTWVNPANTRDGVDRDIYVAPRALAKSTTWFLIAPLWAAAYGHVRFAATFTDSATQAETHLVTFRKELTTNLDLQRDFPDLCRPMTRGRGATVFDTKSTYQAANGFVFSAKGIDSAALGLKVACARR